MSELEGLMSAIIVAVAKTWDSKLPGFCAEFQSQIDAICLQTPLDNIELRNALEKLSQCLTPS
jgi:hypothetical protein